MKRLLAFLLLICLCVSLVACGKNDATPSDSATEPSTEAATEPTERKPLAAVSGNTPTLSSGSGCAGESAGNE